MLVFEGEWDALAGADAIGWGLGERRERRAIFGIRGGRNLRTLWAWSWPDEAQAFLWPDADATGESWMLPEGLAGIMRGRCRAVHTFLPQGVKDFNALHRRYGTGMRANWKEFLRAHFAKGLKMRKRRRPRA